MPVFFNHQFFFFQKADLERKSLKLFKNLFLLLNWNFYKSHFPSNRGTVMSPQTVSCFGSYDLQATYMEKPFMLKSIPTLCSISLCAKFMS